MTMTVNRNFVQCEVLKDNLNSLDCAVMRDSGGDCRL